MSVGVIRLVGLGVALVLVALAWVVSRPQELTAAEQDRADAAIADLQDRKAGEKGALPQAIPISRREVVVCLKGAGFSVHSGEPREVLVVAGRGLPETLVRVIGEGAPAAVPRDDVTWSATAQAIFKMPRYENPTVRRAFFNCVDPRLPAG